VINESGVVPEKHIPNKRDIEISLAAEHDFLETAKSQGVRVLLVQHWTESELRTDQPLQGHTDIRRVAMEAGVPIVDDAQRLRAHLKAGRNPYRDDIHLNDDGQMALSELLLEELGRDFADVLSGGARQARQ
jgi:hypothetical protein